MPRHRKRKAEWSEEVDSDSTGMIKVGRISVSAGQDEGILEQHSAEAAVSYLHLDTKESGMKTASMEVGKCKARAHVGTAGVGMEASAKLVETKLSCIDASVGIGVSTGVGLKDDSATAKIAGCGVTLGRKLGVSIGDTYIGIDLGRIFD